MCQSDRPENGDCVFFNLCYLNPSTFREFSKRGSSPVGVGILVTHDPLHGSGRAALPHPALASGDNAKTLPGIRMTNASWRDPSSYPALHLCPRYTGFLATTLKHPPPDSCHGHAKVTDRNRIHRHRVITHMPENPRAHILPHNGNRRRTIFQWLRFPEAYSSLPDLSEQLLGPRQSA
jgi:hypothetical protein